MREQASPLRRGCRPSRPETLHRSASETVSTLQVLSLTSAGSMWRYWLREQDLNLRPSGYEPDELPGCSIPRHVRGLSPGGLLEAAFCIVFERIWMFFTRSGGDLLSHVLRRSTISATALNGRVRNGIGCFARAMATRPSKEHRSKSYTVLACMLSDPALLFLDRIKPIGPLVSVN